MLFSGIRGPSSQRARAQRLPSRLRHSVYSPRGSECQTDKPPITLIHNIEPKGGCLLRDELRKLRRYLCRTTAKRIIRRLAELCHGTEARFDLMS